MRLNLLVVVIAIVCATEVLHAQYVQLSPPPGTSQTVAQQPGTTLNVNILNNQYVVGQSPYTTIHDAINAAGTTGTVIIPPSYPGNDNWSNPNNVRVFDERPYSPGAYNPVSPLPYTQTVEPQTTLKASEYGARCDNSVDDAPSIQAALNAAVAVSAGAAVAPQPAIPVAVELPTGGCRISAPLVMNGYASLIAHGSTWLIAQPGFPTGRGVVEVTTPVAVIPGGLTPTTLGRTISGLNITYDTNSAAVTGIKVYSPWGTSTNPYPLNTSFVNYQLPAITIRDNNIFALDTAIDIEDCNNCFVFNNYAGFVRVGIAEGELSGANDYGVRIDGNTLLNGSLSYTSNTGPTIGIYVAPTTERWQCTVASPGCSATQTTPITPQGITLFQNSPQAFTNDLQVLSGIGVSIIGNGFDNASQEVAIFGRLNWTFVKENLFATDSPSYAAIEIYGAGVPTDVANTDGWWIKNNFIQSYSTGNAQAGILFDASAGCPTCSQRNLWIEDNQFYKLGYGAYFNQGCVFCVIKNNYAEYFVSGASNGAVVYFNASGSQSFGATQIDGNTSSENILAVYDAAGGGYRLGWNQAGTSLTAPKQLLGSQTLSFAGCTTSGTAGATCTVTSPTVPTWPVAYPDVGYNAFCSGQGGSGNWTTTTPAIVNGSTFHVGEIALASGGTGGGAITCTAIHN